MVLRLSYITKFATVPHATPIKYKSARTMKFSLWFLLSLKRTRSPSPADEQSPEMTDPMLSAPSMYICAMIADAAQFGISPTSPVKNGWNRLFVKRNFERLSSPTSSIRSPSANDAIKRNIQTEAVRFSAFFQNAFGELQEQPQPS